MRKTLVTGLALLGVLAILLAACGGTSDPAAWAVEEYFQALVDKEASALSSLSCAGWEEAALMELDSLQAVETRLDGLACTATAVDGEFTLVNCDGRILATYNDEDQELDLSVRTYQVIEEGGEYLVCGYR
jgi:hypothetical protein